MYRQPVEASLPAETSLLVAYLAREPAFRGIGPRRAAELGRVFGPHLKQVLLDRDDRVIDLIGEEPALAAAAAMETRQAETIFLEWLGRTGANIPPYKAIRIARAWGPLGVEAVQTNPYLLLAVCDWRSVDHLARALGIRETDPRRDVAAVEATLMGEACIGRGSTRLTARDAERGAQRLLGRPSTSNVVELAVAAGAAVRLGDALQPPGTCRMEAECALLLARLMPQEPVRGVTPSDALDRLVAAYEVGQPFPLTDAQREAVRMAHRHRLMVLAGYAGSGKTTVLRGVCETLEAVRRTPLIVALSGRAAQRAAQATGRRAITVARFLVEQDMADRPMTADTALIADEASMLGLVEMWRILRRLGSASLLLCGDPAQLPPVNPGIVFHRLVADEAVPRVVLDRVHRQQVTTGIPDLAGGVRQGRIGTLPEFQGSSAGVSFVPCRRGKLTQEILRIGQVLAGAGTSRRDMQIIAPTNREIQAINTFFHSMRLKARPALWPGAHHLAEGEPVIWSQNDPERGLANGSMGRILQVHQKGALVELDGKEHDFSSSDERFFRLAYAVSVHKAQGSQWRRVIVPVFPSQVLERSLIYTALTRAQEQVIFLGDPVALRAAVAQLPAADKRDCGFSSWLWLARNQVGGER